MERLSAIEDRLKFSNCISRCSFLFCMLSIQYGKCICASIIFFKISPFQSLKAYMLSQLLINNITVITPCFITDSLLLYKLFNFRINISIIHFIPVGYINFDPFITQIKLGLVYGNFPICFKIIVYTMT